MDPCIPIPVNAGSAQLDGGPRKNQRARRARILASARQLLTERGVKDMTVRDIARAANVSLQTVYNLVGPKERAVSEGVSEYILYIGLAAHQGHAHSTISDVVDMWIATADARPEFIRQCNLILFTPQRSIYYAFRAAQVNGLAKLIRKRQCSEPTRATGCALEMAEHAVMFAAALWSEWADRPYCVYDLREKLVAGFSRLIGPDIVQGELC